MKAILNTKCVVVTRPAAHVVRIQLDNSPMNALSRKLRGELRDALADARSDADVRCLILTGAGRAFCAGDDLKEALEYGQDFSELNALFNIVEDFPAPVIAAVNGWCVGGGLELALCCDIRIAAEGANFTAAGVNVGLIASTYRLPRIIGLGRAKAMLLSGAPCDARTAERYGLVTAVVPAADLAATALTQAMEIASRAPLSERAAKRAANAAFDLTRDEANACAIEKFTELERSADHRAALDAFSSHRNPVFFGR
jgi:enoyl-CoA hydratase/carnithine racemase